MERSGVLTMCPSVLIIISDKVSSLVEKRAALMPNTRLSVGSQQVSSHGQRLEKVKTDALVRECKCNPTVRFQKNSRVLQKTYQVGKVFADMRRDEPVEGPMHRSGNQLGKRCSLPYKVDRLDSINVLYAQGSVFA